MSPPLHGIIPPILTPVDSRGRFDETAMRSFVDWLIDRGVHGIFANGSTGEFTRFDESTRRRIVEVVVDAAGGRVPVVAGAAECDLAATLEACGHYHELGVVAAVIVSPIYFRTSQPGIAAYFQQLADRSPLDILLYNIPSLSSEIELKTIVALALQCDRIIGIKDSSGNVPNMIRMIDAIRPTKPEFKFFTGWDGLVGTMMSLGADGGMVATANVVPEAMVSIYDRCVAGDLTTALTLQRDVLALFDVLLAVQEFPEGFRIGVAHRGLDLGHSLTPIADVHTDANRDAKADIGCRVDGVLDRIERGSFRGRVQARLD